MILNGRRMLKFCLTHTVGNSSDADWQPRNKAYCLIAMVSATYILSSVY